MVFYAIMSYCNLKLTIINKNYFNPEREIKMTLKELEIGKTADIISTGGEGALRQHFLDMGLIPGAEVTMVKFAPMGDPLVSLLRWLARVSQWTQVATV